MGSDLFQEAIWADRFGGGMAQHMANQKDSTAKLSEEVRVKDPSTGGEKGAKLARFSLIPPEVEWALAEHYGVGAKKYDDNNWLKGYKWSLNYDALRRHLSQWQRGESYDQETGSHHLVAVIWHAIALYTFERRNLGTDDLRLQHTRKEEK